MSAPDPVRSLLDRLSHAGGRVTTNGRKLRIREWAGPIPAALLGELQLRQREVFRYLMADVPRHVPREVKL